MERGRQRVLVVEDDPAVRQLYATALGFAGFSPVPADDGFGALRALEGDDIDAVVLDLNLPYVDGRSVLEEIHDNEHTSHIPVIVVTGSDIDAHSIAATVVLKKPCGPYKLLQIVTRELKLRSAHAGESANASSTEDGAAAAMSCGTRSRSGNGTSAASEHRDSRRRSRRRR